MTCGTISIGIAVIAFILKAIGATVTPPFTAPPQSCLPRMLRVRDGLRDGLGRDLTYLRVALNDPGGAVGGEGGPPPSSRLEARPMTRQEVVHLVKVFTSLGIRKVRLAGGEPLLRRDLEPIVAGISPEVEGRVHLTTDGILLARRARALFQAGLAGVNISLVAADRAAYQRTTQKDALGKVLAGVEAARSAGLSAKLNAMVVRGWNEDQILPLARLAQREGLHLRFIEAMPYLGPNGDPDRFISGAEILRTVREGLGIDLVEETSPAADDGPVRNFCIPGSDCKVGVISTLSANACARCNRVRLTARGELKACLFGSPTADLLELVRQHASRADLIRLIRQTLQAKRPCHPLRRPLHRDEQPELAQGLWQLGG